MRLRTKLVLVLLFVTVVLGGGVFVGFDHLREQSVARAQANVDETATTAAARIDDRLRQRRDRVARAAAGPDAERFDHAESFLEQFLRNSRFRTARVVTANGTVVGYQGDVSAATREAALGTNVSDRDHVRRALDGNATIGAVSCSEQCETTIAAPIYVGTDVGGALVATVPLERADVFAPVVPVAGSERTLRVVADVDGERSVLEEPSRTFDRAITATATAETTGWQVVVSRSRTELNQQLRSMLYVEGISLLLVLGAVLTLGGWEYRTTLEQTDQLLAGFGALREGDYDHSLSLRAAEEWRQVSEGFNSLADGLRERDERLQVLNRALRHNLRNDLTVVMGNAKKISNASDDPEIRRACEEILDASESLESMGETARAIETAMGKPTAERETVDVAAVLRSILEEARSAHAEVDVETEIPESLPVEAPPGIELALEQVCTNAFEHNTNDDPRVRVEAARTERDDSDWLTVTVADNGPGIPPQDRQALMAAEETPTEHSSGLGLWFVHWLIERADGDLAFAENDPTGEIVTIELPVE